MIRQPMQRFAQMQASDVDIYRNEIRKTNAQVVRVAAAPLLGAPSGGQVAQSERGATVGMLGRGPAHGWPTHGASVHLHVCRGENGTARAAI